MHFQKLFYFSFLFTLLSCKPEASSIILKDANIINVNNGQIALNSILIKDGYIREINKFIEVPSGIAIIDAKGKFIIPGLFDMHTHIHEHENSTRFLDSLLKLGITGIRDMGGHADSIALLKTDINRGLITAPDIFFAGYTLDGHKDRDDTDPTTWIITDTTDLNKIVGSLKKHNVDFLKVHSYFPHSRFIELMEIASNNRLTVAGHIPRKIDLLTSIESGLATVEHANSLIESLVTTPNNDIDNITEAFNSLDSVYLKSLAASFNKNNAAFTPTLHIINKVYESNPDEGLRKLGKLMTGRFLQITKILHENDVLILAGSDDVPVNQTNLTALHQELQWLVKAGLTPLEALQTATINPVKVLNIQAEYGSVEIGKKADLLILNKNPLDDISNTLTVSNTIKNGKLLN